jgi:hypothetical protein
MGFYKKNWSYCAKVAIKRGPHVKLVPQKELVPSHSEKWAHERGREAAK